MEFLNTQHKRKSATITTVVLVILLILMFLFGMTYLDPPEESGIAVNFGTTSTGSGKANPKDGATPDVTPVKPQKATPQETSVPETQSETTPNESAPEELLTSDNEESVKIKQQEEAKRKAKEVERKAKTEADRIAKEKAEAEERKRKEEEAKRNSVDDLIKGVKDSKGPDDGPDGDDKDPGNKGDLKGDYSPMYSGQPGSGTGGQGGSGLRGRKSKYKAKVIPNCNETGKVVMNVTVNNKGEVLNAKLEIKGSTNTAKCLVDAAKEAAMKSLWSSDPEAPEKQYGVIEFNFSLKGQ